MASADFTGASKQGLRMGITADQQQMIQAIGKPSGGLGNGMSLRTIHDEQEGQDFSLGYKDVKQSKSSMNHNAANRDIVKRNALNSVGPTIENASSSNALQKHKPISVWDQIQVHDSELFYKEVEEKRRQKKLEQ
jgi:hypothetical protein